MRKFLFCLLSATVLSGHAFAAEDSLPQITPEKKQSSPSIGSVSNTRAIADESKKDSQPSNYIAPAASALTLEAAIEHGLSNSPNLKSFAASVMASRGEFRQSSAWANPEVGVEAENVAGQGAYKGFDSAEVTYGLTQEFQIGGKISARENIAGKGLEISNLDYQAAALDVIKDVTTAYAEAVAAEENVRLATEQKELAEDVLKSVSVRVGAAAAPLIQKSRAEVERSTATIALDTAMREREIARKKLAAVMGEEVLTSTLDSTAFYSMAKPDVVNAEEKLKSNPDVARLNSSLEQSKARLDLEQANTIPDPRLSVGMRDFRDSGDQAFVVGVSLPIPVFNANRGNIEKARHEVNRTEMDNRNTTLTVNADLTRTQQQMENAYMRADMLKTEVLPSADKAFRLAREGYGAGRFPYLEVLDAQRSLFDVKQQHIAALKEFHTSKAQVERLTAMHLPKIQDKGAINAE